MKPRKLLARIRSTKEPAYQWLAAHDPTPGTEFDILFHIAGNVRPLRFSAASAAEQLLDKSLEPWKREGLERIPKPVKDIFAGGGWEGTNQEAMQAIGQFFSDAIMAGDSDLFHKVGRALDEWHSHKPNPDKLRIEIIDQFRDGKPHSMRDMLKHLRSKKLIATLRPHEVDPARKQVARICAELGVIVRGKPGRPTA